MRPETKHSLRLLQATISIAFVYYLLQLVDWQALEQLLVSGIFPALWPGPLILLLGLLLAAERWRAVLVFFRAWFKSRSSLYALSDRQFLQRAAAGRLGR